MGDYTETERETMRAAGELANQRLAQVEYDRKHLEQEEVRLRELIRAIDAVIGTASVQSSSPLFLSSVPQTAAQKTRAILAEAGHALSLDEIVEEMTERGLLAGKAPKDAVKTALRNHPSVFVRHGNGVYGLAEWTPPSVV